MCPAAGADIGVFDRHDPHVSCERLFAPVRNLLELLRGGECNFDFAVFPDDLVCLALDGLQVFLREHAGKVDRHHVGPHMEAHVVVAETAVDNAGENVLAGVQLHEAEPALPVDSSLNVASNIQRLFAVVDDLAICFVRIRHAHVCEITGIARLAAALGIKGRFVQHYVEPVLSRRAGQNLRLKCLAVYILIKELFRCHMLSPTALFSLLFYCILAHYARKSNRYFHSAIFKLFSRVSD